MTLGEKLEIIYDLAIRIENAVTEPVIYDEPEKRIKGWSRQIQHLLSSVHESRSDHG